MRTISKLRFKAEPTGLRGVANSGMCNASKDWTMALDEATGIIYMQTPKWERALHISDCAWVEFAPPAPAVTPPTKK